MRRDLLNPFKYRYLLDNIPIDYRFLQVSHPFCYNNVEKH